MVHLLDLIHQKLELYRLESRYTRRRNRRSTFVSEALYVDGEYIYSPTCSKFGSSASGSGSSDSDEAGREEGTATQTPTTKQNKRLSRMWGKKEDKLVASSQGSRVSVREVR